MNNRVSYTHHRDAQTIHRLSFYQQSHAIQLNQDRMTWQSNRLCIQMKHDTQIDTSDFMIQAKRTAVSANKNIKIDIEGSLHIETETLTMTVNATILSLSQSLSQLHAQSIILYGHDVQHSGAIICHGDEQTCPQVTQETPHVGGSVQASQSSVTINNHAIVCHGDYAICNGPQPTLGTTQSSICVDKKPILNDQAMTSHAGHITASQNRVTLKSHAGSEPTIHTHGSMTILEIRCQCMGAQTLMVGKQCTLEATQAFKRSLSLVNNHSLITGINNTQLRSRLQISIQS